MFPLERPALRAEQRRGTSHLYEELTILEARILRLVEDHPGAAAKSELGRLHLTRYAWMLDKPYEKMGYVGVAEPINEYPYRFCLGDVLLHGDEIARQLIAQEYLEDAGELTPFTPDVLIPRPSVVGDPFGHYAPRVTYQAELSTGEVVTHRTYGGEPIAKPEYGFREVAP